MTTADPPGAMMFPNSSRTRAVPYRSTARITSGVAWLGETPAAWITPVTSPSAVAVSTSACTDSREDTSTVVVLTSKPALASTSAASSALLLWRSATTTCLPALTRRAIAWPIWPAPMTTMTSLMSVSFLLNGFDQADSHSVSSRSGDMTDDARAVAVVLGVVRRIDFLVRLRRRCRELDRSVDSSSLDTASPAGDRGAVPRSLRSACGTDVQVIRGPDDPHGREGPE